MNFEHYNQKIGAWESHPIDANETLESLTLQETIRHEFQVSGQNIEKNWKTPEYDNLLKAREEQKELEIEWLAKQVFEEIWIERNR